MKNTYCPNDSLIQSDVFRYFQKNINQTSYGCRFAAFVQLHTSVSISFQLKNKFYKQQQPKIKKQVANVAIGDNQQKQTIYKSIYSMRKYVVEIMINKRARRGFQNIIFMASDICKLLLFQTNRGLDMMADNIRARSATTFSIFYLVPTVFGQVPIPAILLFCV